ncbi:MAG: ATP-binding protein [Desulfovibrio sp.]|jgi:predicted AAA+ superfamily ATPase|nr:ATP-binding protein [Desulfovibrio sp.]
MEATLAKSEKFFGAVLVTGARQVGKTTLLKKLKPDLGYFSLDDPVLLRSALEEPGTFCKMMQPPAIIDEVQYAPGLFPHLKMLLDTLNKKGLFFLSGSQQFQMMKNVGESLAGRLGILNLPGLSLRELGGIACDLPFLPEREYFAARKKEPAAPNYRGIWEIIQRGDMPALYENAEMDWQMFYAAYTRTYIERDVRDLAQVGDEGKFLKFMTSVAARTGQLLNLASISRDAGVSQSTIDRWLSILRASNLIYLLEPYHNNVTKRAIKTPKLYFLNTGLAAYLTRWNTPEVLRNGAMAGAFFETFVVAEILKSYANAGIMDPPLYFYRDKERNEIDLVIRRGMTLYPLEIKKHADPRPDDAAVFAALDKIPGVTRAPGGVLCLYETLAPLQGEDVVIPLRYV